jgi:hypothetical protein
MADKDNKRGRQREEFECVLLHVKDKEHKALK